jgi:catechol 2,3-dioxygenase-like lactoylglutathione lyase family enzyme
MSSLGQFLELSVPAPDLAASLDFYLRLGFSELRVNDIRPGSYAVVTDGQIVIGLHGAGLDEPALTFVKPDVARHARALQDTGTELDFQRLDNDQFNEVGLRTPDGLLLQLLEAATFTVADDEFAAPLIGRCTELGLCSATPADTRNFFELAGFLGTDGEDEDSVLLSAPGLSLAIRPEMQRSGVTLRFEPTGDWRQLLELRGFPLRRAGPNDLLVAPEGTRLLLVAPGRD